MKAVKAEKENPMLKFSEGPHVVRLESDMVTMSEEPLKIEISNCPIEGHDFFEASSMRKINGVYYFIYSSKNSHELCYATGDSPVGPFVYGGVLLSNGDIGYDGRTDAERVTYTGNNHGSLVELKNQWYIFGHRMTNYTAFSRQGIAEPVNIAADGSIAQAELTSCGLNNGPLMGQGKYEARIACALRSKMGAGHYIDGCMDEAGLELRKNHPVFCQDGEDREENPDQYIGNMRDGSVAGFKYFVFNDSCNISVTTRGDSGCFKISQEMGGKVVAEIPIEAGEEWHDSEVVSFITGQGKSALYFTYVGNGMIDFMTFTLNEKE